MTLDELRACPATIKIPIAAKALGISRAQAYALASRGEFPTRVLKLGSTFRIPTEPLIRFLEASDSPKGGTE